MDRRTSIKWMLDRLGRDADHGCARARHRIAQERDARDDGERLRHRSETDRCLSSRPALAAHVQRAAAQDGEGAERSDHSGGREFAERIGGRRRRFPRRMGQRAVRTPAWRSQDRARRIRVARSRIGQTFRREESFRRSRTRAADARSATTSATRRSKTARSPTPRNSSRATAISPPAVSTPRRKAARICAMSATFRCRASTVRRSKCSRKSVSLDSYHRWRFR